jgi:hypothetical protein
LRHLQQAKELTPKMLQCMNRRLCDRGMLLKRPAIVDATIPARRVRQRARVTSAIIDVDVDSGVVHTLTTTSPSSIADNDSQFLAALPPQQRILLRVVPHPQPLPTQLVAQYAECRTCTSFRLRRHRPRQCDCFHSHDRAARIRGTTSFGASIPSFARPQILALCVLGPDLVPWQRGPILPSVLPSDRIHACRPATRVSAGRYWTNYPRVKLTAAAVLPR